MLLQWSIKTQAIKIQTGVYVDVFSVKHQKQDKILWQFKKPTRGEKMSHKQQCGTVRRKTTESSPADNLDILAL